MASHQTDMSAREVRCVFFLCALHRSRLLRRNFVCADFSFFFFLWLFLSPSSWHSHTKVLRDLNEFGRVQLYCDHPNDAEGEAEYQRAMKNSERLKKLHAEWEANNAATSSTDATSATTMAESTEESTAPVHATTQ